MTTATVAPYTLQQLRNAFATRCSTPDAVVLERALRARRLGVGIFEPVALENHRAWEQFEAEDLERARKADAWLAEAFRSGAIKVLVGVNHPTPLSALEDGQGVLCAHESCCAGRLPTPEQNHLDIVQELEAQLAKAWRRGEDDEAREILATLKAAGVR